jgi:hypothetical protein
MPLSVSHDVLAETPEPPPPDVAHLQFVAAPPSVPGFTIERAGPAVRVHGTTLRAEGPIYGLDLKLMGLEYGAANGAYFPLFHEAFSLVANAQSDHPNADGGAFRLNTPAFMLRTYLPGIGLRSTFGTNSLQAALVPSVAFLFYEGAATSPPGGHFGDVTRSAEFFRTATLGSLDLELAYCGGGAPTKKHKNQRACIVVSPILLDASVSGSITPLAGARANIAVAF